MNRQGVPSRELFEHFLLAVRPYFYPVGKPEEEKRQAEHALYLFCLHNITDSFAPKPTDNEVNLPPPRNPTPLSLQCEAKMMLAISTTQGRKGNSLMATADNLMTLS